MIKSYCNSALKSRVRCAAVQRAVVPGYPHFRLSLSIGGAVQTLAAPMENVVRRADLQRAAGLDGGCVRRADQRAVLQKGLPA